MKLSINALILLVALLSGCSQQMPLMSHAHMGHSLTAWHDTPDNQALLTVAEKELAIALAEGAAATLETTDSAVQLRLRNIVHALNPDIETQGPGLGYGAIRALQGTIEHLEYAAASEDSSDNLVISVATLTGHGEAIENLLADALQLAVAARSETGSDIVQSLAAVKEKLHRAAAGSGAAAGGAVDTVGLVGLHDEMQAMLKRETDPRYEPLPRRYVLGLVRLPNGKWGYRLPKRNAAFADSGYGAYGY